MCVSLIIIISCFGLFCLKAHSITSCVLATLFLPSVQSRPLPPSKQPDFDIVFGHLDDEHIPFPRTSGARFCSNGGSPLHPQPYSTAAGYVYNCFCYNNFSLEFCTQFKYVVDNYGRQCYACHTTHPCSNVLLTNTIVYVFIAVYCSILVYFLGPLHVLVSVLSPVQVCWCVSTVPPVWPCPLTSPRHQGASC